MPVAASFFRISSLSRWLSARSHVAVCRAAVMIAACTSAGSFDQLAALMSTLPASFTCWVSE